MCSCINQSEYYSCDATYRNWLKIEIENADVSPTDLTVEERQRAVAAARETLESSLLLLSSKSSYFHESTASMHLAA